MEQLYYRLMVRSEMDKMENIIGTYRTEEKVLEELAKKKEQIKEDKSYDPYPLWDDRECFIRILSETELRKERQEIYEERLRWYHDTYLQYCDDNFSDCCRRVIDSLRTKMERLTEEERSTLRQEEKTTYSMWLNFHEDAKVLALVNWQEGGRLALGGMFVTERFSDFVSAFVCAFDGFEECMKWLSGGDASALVFEQAMKQDGRELFKYILKLPVE